MKLYILKVLSFGFAIVGSVLLLNPTQAIIAAPDTALAATTTPPPAIPASQPSVVPGVPVALSIPKISLNVGVIPVGLTKDNAVDVPDTLKLAGWFTNAAIPGDEGSALIDGHVGNSAGIPGVFANLHKLQIGDTIYVKDKNGNTERFVVKDMEVYPLAKVPMDTILQNTDGHRLNIITCAGTWVQSEDTFDHRLVVYTELAP